jgi:hypothetical protein
MRALTAVLFSFVVSLPCLAADAIVGRWQGQADVPGRLLHLTIDLDRNPAGAWIGSIVIPELNMKGATLSDISVDGNAISFAIKNALGEPNAGQATFRGQIDSDAAIAGDFSQSGNTAKFALKKIGAASVDLPLSSTPLEKEFEGKWLGEYEFGGVPRHVTMNFVNHAGSAATAQFVIVGKKTTDVPVDLVRQDAALVVVQSSEYQITYEGRLHKDKAEITGTFTQGPFDLPLNLRREQ